MNKKINVFVVEDSPAAQLLLVHILNSDPRLHVIGMASNGEEIGISRASPSLGCHPS